MIPPGRTGTSTGKGIPMRQAPTELPKQAHQPSQPPLLAELEQAFRNRQPAEAVQFQDVNASTLVEALDKWTGHGYAIILGRTSDGGAIAVQLLAGAWRHKLYASTPDELEALCVQLSSVGSVPS